MSALTIFTQNLQGVECKQLFTVCRQLSLSLSSSPSLYFPVVSLLSVNFHNGGKINFELKLISTTKKSKQAMKLSNMTCLSVCFSTMDSAELPHTHLPTDRIHFTAQTHACLAVGLTDILTVSPKKFFFSDCSY